MNENLSSLIEAFRRWLRLRGYHETSIRDYPRSLKLFFRLLEERQIIEEGHVDLLSITPQVVAEYQRLLYDHISVTTYAKLSANTQLGMLCVVITFSRFLLSTHRIAKDPCCDLRLPRQIRRLPKDLLTPEESKKLLSIPDINTVVGFRDRVILEIFWACGMRVSELLSLVVEDVNFREGLITIRQGKGARDRVVPVGSGTLDWIRRYLENVRPLFVKSFKNQTDFLFVGWNGKHLDKSGVQAKLKLYARRARIKKNVTTHTFRHTLATEMLKRGADLRHIQEILGHERLTTTQKYTHIVKADLKKMHGHAHPREQIAFVDAVYRGVTHEACS